MRKKKKKKKKMMMMMLMKMKMKKKKKKKMMMKKKIKDKCDGQALEHAPDGRDLEEIGPVIARLDFHGSPFLPPCFFPFHCHRCRRLHAQANQGDVDPSREVLSHPQRHRETRVRMGGRPDIYVII